VTPEAGLVGTTFTFEVTYEDGDGDAPSETRVLVGGTPYDMALVSGDYESGALFRVAVELPVGAYDHVFSFRDGHTPVVTTPPAAGPAVGRLLFVMGSPEDEPGRDPDETRHTVVFTRRFWIEDHEVTQDGYEAVMKTNPSRFVGANRPVERVTWLDAILYCNARSTAEGYQEAYSILGTAVTWNKDANGYRLPTEAEWEAACRAGTETAFAGGAITEQGCGIDPVLDVAGWYCGNALGATHAVKGKQPNAWDPPLYDMHGNVWEWCWDFYRADLGSAIAVDPEGSPGGSQRVIRGGSWYYFARDCRSASRAPYWPNSADDIVGFRVARTLFEE
jgi:formylglycine-generating enzyme required for sulfatase activity